MGAGNKSTGFKQVIHFFSCWGIGDGIVALLGTIGAIIWPTTGKPVDWMMVAVGALAVFVYAMIAYMSRPDDAPDEDADRV